MLGVQIKDYDEFRDIFGTCRSSRGSITNKILLSFWMHRYLIDKDFRATQIKDMRSLFNLVMDSIQSSTHHRYTLNLSLGDFKFSTTSDSFSSAKISCDLRNLKNISYVDHDHQDKMYSMGAGKLFRKLLKEHGARLNESVITYCSEEFQRLWDAAINKLYSGYVLHVDQHFNKIYKSSYLKDSFGSCMVDKGYHTFYANNVKASAAYLTKDDKIYARCVVFHDVYTRDGVKHNYAERQYATNGDDTLKTLLIQELINRGVIDIYKTIGAGCRSITSIVDKNGVTLKDPYIYTKCNIKHGDTKSFQDTFKYFFPQEGVLANYAKYSSQSYEFDHTSGTYGGEDSSMTDSFDRSDLIVI